MGCSTLNVQRCGDGDGDRFYNSFNVVETAEITIIIQEIYNFMPTGMYVIWHQAILYYQVFGNIFRIPVSFSYDTIVRSASAVSCSQYIFILLVPSSGPMCIFLLFTFLFSISLPRRNSVVPCVSFYFLLFYSPSPSLDVTQVRGHYAGSSPPSPLRHAPLFLSR